MSLKLRSARRKSLLVGAVVTATAATFAAMIAVPASAAAPSPSGSVRSVTTHPGAGTGVDHGAHPVDGQAG